MAVINFYDTSALMVLQDNTPIENLYVSLLVISELENIKNSALKNDTQKYAARKVGLFLEKNEYMQHLFREEEIEKEMKRIGSYLTNKNDSFLICEASLLSKKNEVTFFTADLCQYLLCKHLFKDIQVQLINQTNEAIFWNGYKKVCPTDAEWTKLYTSKENVFNSVLNEYLLLYTKEGELKEIIRWTGEEHVRLGYKSIKNCISESITPRNLEQKVYLDLLQNPDIPVVSCVAKRGCGKTFLALHCGLDMVEHNYYDKVMYIRNNWEVEGTKETGSLPGTLEEKTAWMLAPISDIIGDEYVLEDMINKNQFEYVHLNFIRGRNLSHAFIIVDEAQNLTKSMVQLIISRLGEGSKIVFCGDYTKQTDNKLFRQDSGLIALNAGLQNNELFGQVQLEKVERSKICALADLLD